MNDGMSGRQLVVIGNGFDLACGLKSSYADFFDPRLDVIGDILGDDDYDWKQAVDDQHLTVWDFILRVGDNGPDWCNVERAISDWVLIIERDDPERTRLDELFDLLEKEGMSDILAYSLKSYSMSELDKLGENGIHLLDVYRYVSYKMGYVYDQGRHLDRSTFLPFLRDELDVLEQQFKEHLLNECNTHMTGYTEDANTLAEHIISAGVSHLQIGGYGKNDISILSFNYTMPQIYFFGIYKDANVVNIHGRLDGKIIFGVDGKECMDDLAALPFTKTYRVASLGTGMTNALYDTVKGNGGESRTKVIKFFGHSLGEADYSYFQSIFDGVNLYGGGTKLVFYYQPWLGKDEEELHTETVQRVTKLLVTYGSTLDNQDHGKNLMHKLLLEGRLEIRKLP